MTERIKVKLVEIVEETDTMKTFKFVSLKNEIPFFSPGQFVFLYAKINGEEIKRSYSISSSPLDKTFDLGLELVENGKMTTYFHKNVKIPGNKNEFNEQLAKATRVSDFLELGELFAIDALERNESCGGHFREEFQTSDGEAIRDDENFKFVSAWEYNQDPSKPILNKEGLDYEEIEIKTRSYK